MPYFIVPKAWKDEPLETDSSAYQYFREYASYDQPATTLALFQYACAAAFDSGVDTWQWTLNPYHGNDLHYTPFGSAQEAHTALTASGLRATHETVIALSYGDKYHFNCWKSYQSWSIDQQLPYGWHREYRCPTVYDSGRTIDVHAHRSTADPDQIAYFPSADSYLRRVAKRTTVSRYLRHFWPNIHQDVHDRLVGQWKAEPRALQIATSAEDIVAVYTAEHGIDSCMSKPASHYSSQPYHPVAAYGNSDLAVAYLGDLAFETIIARAVVHVLDKYFVRAYGDISTIKSALIKAGYDERDSFDGARIKALRNDRKALIAPYLDGDSQGADLYDGWLTICEIESAEYDCAQTDGLARLCENYGTCVRCDSRLTEDDNDYCESCEMSRIECETCGTYDFPDNMNEVSGARFCSDCYTSLPTCQSCDTHFRIDNLTEPELLARREDFTTDYCLDCTEHGHDRVCQSCDNFTYALADTCDTCGDTTPIARRCNRTRPLPFGLQTRYATVAPINQPATAGSIYGVMTRGQWVICDTAAVIAKCHIHDCDRTHIPGTFAFQSPEGFAYCHSCALHFMHREGLAELVNTAPRDAIADVATRDRYHRESQVGVQESSTSYRSDTIESSEGSPF